MVSVVAEAAVVVRMRAPRPAPVQAAIQCVLLQITALQRSHPRAPLGCSMGVSLARRTPPAHPHRARPLTPHPPLALPTARPLTLRAPLCGAGQAYGALLLAGLCGDSVLAHGTAGLAAPDGALVVAALR